MHNSEVRAEQVTKSAKTSARRQAVKAAPELTPKVPPEAIFLGADLGKKTIWVTRMIDHGTPQPAQRFTWEKFYDWVAKQLTLANKVYLVYEAGAFGYVPYRKLKALGVEAYVVHPEKLDPRHRRVQTDRTDSRQLCENLVRFVRGNTKAMTVIYVPTETEERQRIEARHRQHLSEQCRSLKARGKGLLLSQGIFDNEGWWEETRWQSLQKELAPELQAALTDDRALLAAYEQRLRVMNEKLTAAAPQELPVGFGALTFVLLARELCNFQRFENRRGVGGFTGLCGGISQSGDYRAELSINKRGSGRLRALLIELAWRMVHFQPQYTGLKVWQRFCVSDGGKPSQRHKKIAIVAAAHQLAVDLWRWQCGWVTPEALGLRMPAA